MCRILASSAIHNNKMSTILLKNFRQQQNGTKYNNTFVIIYVIYFELYFVVIIINLIP